MKKILITILSIILILLLGLIGYQYLNNDEEIIEDEKVEINNEIYKGENLTVEKINYLTDEDKIDSTKPFLYAIMPTYDEGENSWGTIKERKYKNEFVNYEKNIKDITSVPYINIKLEDVDKINHMLKSYCLTNYRSIFDGNINDEDLFNSVINVNDDVLSIFLTGDVGQTCFNIGINYDLKTKKLLSLDEVINKLSITDEDLKSTIEQHHNEMKEDSRYCEVEAIDLFNRIKRNSNLDYKIFREDIDLNKSVDEYAQIIYPEENNNLYSVLGWNEDNVDDHTFTEDLINNQKVCYYINEENKLVIKYYYRQTDSKWIRYNEIVVA